MCCVFKVNPLIVTRFDMEKGVEKILLDRQVAKDRGVLGAVNVAVWHRSVVYEPKKDLEKKLPDRVAKKCERAKFCFFSFGFFVHVSAAIRPPRSPIVIICRYLTKKAASERFGMHAANAEARGDGYARCLFLR